jgi:hypothetical protein
VTVDGQKKQVLGINPLAGAIILEDDIGREVEASVDYSYVESPRIDLQGSSKNGYLFDGPPPNATPSYRSFFADDPCQTRDQPTQRDITFQALEQDYTTRFNDPVHTRFNQHPSTPRRESYDLLRIDLSFEGRDHPNPDVFDKKGPSPSATPDVEGGLYTLQDVSSSSNNIDGEPSYFVADQEFEKPRFTNLRSRLRIQDVHQKDHDFTGVSMGWTTNEDVIFGAFLEKDGLYHAALLSDKGDESSLSSYQGISAVVDANDGRVLHVSDQTSVFDEQDDIRVGDTLATVLHVNDSVLTLDTSFSTGSFQEVYPSVDAETLSSYQIVSNSQHVSLRAASGDVLSVIEHQNLPSLTEPFRLFEPNQFFFGSTSRRASNTSVWDFYRVSSVPTQSSLLFEPVHVRHPFTSEGPLDGPHPWITSQSEGRTYSLNNGEILLEQNGQSLGYHRIEPFLGRHTSFDLDTSLQCDGWADGIAASVHVADHRKEVLLGLFSDANDLNTTLSYNGLRSFENEGWNISGESSVDTSFIDEYARIEYDGSTSFEATRGDTFNQPPNFVTDFVFKLTCQIHQYDLDNNDQTGFIFGAGNAGGEELFFRFSKQGLNLVDANGLPSRSIDADQWQDGEMHTYKVALSGGTVSIFVDGEFQASEPASSFSPPTTSEDLELTLRYEDVSFDATLDSFVGYDILYGAPSDRKVGLYQGGDRFDPSNYASVDIDWLNQSVDIDLSFDRDGTEIYLNQEQTPSFDVSYEQLPDRSSTRLNTGLGYIEFGSFDERAFSSVRWDHIHYRLVTACEDDKVNTSNNTQFNDHHVVTSDEPVYDDAIQRVELTSINDHEVDVSELDITVGRVVFLVENGASPSFEYDEDFGLVRLTSGHTFSSDSASVTLFVEPKEPYTFSYLKDKPSTLTLYEDTPLFEETDRSSFDVVESYETSFNEDDAFNEDDTLFNETRTHISYETSSEGRGLYSDLRVCSTEDGEDHLLYPAQDTFHDMSLDHYEESYQIPTPPRPGWTQEEPLTLDDEGDTLDDSSFVLDGIFGAMSGDTSEVRGNIKDVREEVYAGVQEEDTPVGVFEDHEGAIVLDASDYELDSTSGELDHTSTTTTNTDFQNTFNWPP